MLEVIRYKNENKETWDAFVSGSKNGTFLFFRDYMDYHADRFTDHSLLFYRKGKLMALLPANEMGQELRSHGGLTYGGILCNSKMKAAVMIAILEALQLYMKDTGFNTLNYKAIPHIYHQSPAEEDLYALICIGATLVRRDLNSVVSLDNTLPYSQLRKRKLNQAIRASLSIKQSDAFGEFMKMKEELLWKRYSLKPTHTAEEISQLARKFPQHIKLYIALEKDELVAGIVVYETHTVAHCQYIGATERGKMVSGLDVLINYLLTEVYAEKKYFSFGVSTEQEGHYLNENLVRNKESYGARTVVQDFYELKV